MKVLITGANGLLGQKLVGLFVKERVDFIATSKGPCRIDYLSTPFEYQSLDITNKDEVDRVISTYKPDTVIHTAAMTNVDQCENEQEACRLLNVDATANIIAACEANGAFLVHLSTDFVFDGEDGPYKEEDRPNPVSFYGQSKLDAENLVMSSRCEWAIARTVLVYGITPGMSRSNIILWVKENLENGNPLNIVDDQWRTPTLAEDLAMGCYLIAKKRAQGIFNISGEEMLTPYQMAMKAAQYFNLDQSLISKVDASTFSQPAKRPPKTGFVIDKAKEILGFNPSGFDQGIRFLDQQIRFQNF